MELGAARRERFYPFHSPMGTEDARSLPRYLASFSFLAEISPRAREGFTAYQDFQAELWAVRVRKARVLKGRLGTGNYSPHGDAVGTTAGLAQGGLLGSRAACPIGLAVTAAAILI